MLLESIGSYSNLLITFAMICFYFGSCWLLSLFIKDIIEHDVSQFNLDVLDQETLVEIIDHFRNLADDSSKVKQLSRITMCFDFYLSFSISISNNHIFEHFSLFSRFTRQINEIYEVNIFMLFLWTLLNICCALLAFMAELVEYRI